MACALWRRGVGEGEYGVSGEERCKSSVKT